MNGCCWLAVAVLFASTGLVGWLPFEWGLPTFAVASLAFLFLSREVLVGRLRPSWWLAFGVVLVLRLVCLPHAPSLSDDIYRYLHEGQLVLSGLNPYLLSPAETPEGLRGGYFDLINNPDIPAAYPPAVQFALAAGAWVSPEPFGMKVVFGAFDVLTFAALWCWLPVIGVPAARALLYGLCPLLAIEFAGQGHGDTLAVFFMVLALLASSRRRPLLAAGALAIATAGKFIPVVLLPFLLRKADRRVAAATVFGVVLVGLYLPFLAPPAEMFRGTFEYAMRWRSNDSLFAIVHVVADWIVGTGWFEGFDSKFFREPQRLAKLPLMLLALGVLGWSWRRDHQPHRVALLFMVFFVAAAPTLHPWYVVLLVPFLCIYPNWGFLVFTGSVFLAYHVLPRWLAEGVWEEQPWITVVEYVPFYLGVVALAVRPPQALQVESPGAST